MTTTMFDPMTERERSLKRERLRLRRALIDAQPALEQPPEVAKPKRKRKGPSPNKLTIDFCEARGWLAGIVEQRIPHTFITRDLFKIIDIVAIDGRKGLIGIQATGGLSGVAGQRMEKISSDECRPAAVAWLKAGLRLEVWHWRATNDGVVGAKKEQHLRRFKAYLDGSVLTWDDAEEMR